MLVSNSSYNVGDVVGLKLVNGDEIIGKLKEITPMSFTVERPLAVIPGAKGIMLMNAMFCLAEGKSVIIKSEHVMMACEAIEQLRDHYIEMTTGIKPVTKGSIITS